MVTALFARPIATWCYNRAVYRVRLVDYADGSAGLVIDVLGPAGARRSALVRGNLAGIEPVAGWERGDAAARSAVIEALFDPARWC
jgi:hypothetical protein